MAVLPIITDANAPVLHAKTKNVPKVTKEIQKLIKDMEATVKQADGAGLAAPQIGQSLRLCLALINKKQIALINPEITWRSTEIETAEEGCLSLPGIWRNVTRPREIIVKYTDQGGQQQERKLADFNARVVQHEVDHLDGILITDYVDAPLTIEPTPRQPA